MLIWKCWGFSEQMAKYLILGQTGVDINLLSINGCLRIKNIDLACGLGT